MSGTKLGFLDIVRAGHNVQCVLEYKELKSWIVDAHERIVPDSVKAISSGDIISM